MKNIGKDFKEKIKSGLLNDLAQSHLDVWKERYRGYKKADVKHDLAVSHDPSIEVEAVEDLLQRKLTDEEYNVFIDSFNKSAVKQYKRQPAL